MNRTTDAVRELHRAGAHILRCDETKKAIGKWRKVRHPEEDCVLHTQNGNRVGIIPASLGAVVVDVDKGLDDSKARLQAVVDRIGIPAFLHQSSKTGNYHLWYRWEGVECRNHSWKIMDGDTVQASGELRGTNGYVVMWNPVKVLDKLSALQISEPVDLTLLLEHTPELPPTHGDMVQRVSKVNMGEMITYEEVSEEKIRELLDCIDPDIDYTDWIAVGQAIHSQWPDSKGLALWDEWSQKGHTYDAAGDNSPARKWATFNELREGGVTIGKLFYYAKLASTTPQAPPPVQVSKIHNITLTMPHGYKRVKMGGKNVIQKTMKDTNGNMVDQTVSQWDLFPVAYGMDENLGYETARFQWERPRVGWTELIIRASHLSQGNREFGQSVCDQGIPPMNKHMMEAFQMALRDFRLELQRHKTVTPLYQTMGWKDEFSCFVLGGSLLRREKDGSVTEESTSFSQGVRKKKMEAFREHGRKSQWVASTKIIDRGRLYPHGFVLGVGFSAPLYAYTGLAGLTLSLYGATGGGKTLAQWWAQSIWGNPDELHVRANHTMNSLYNRMGMYCHLPVTIDEVTMMNDKDVGNFCFCVSQGSDRMRLSKNAQETAVQTWSTPVVVSTNKSLHSKLVATGLETDAQLARLLEVSVKPNKLFTESSEIGRTLYQLVHENYGHVGKQFATNLVAMGEQAVVEMINHNLASFQNRYHVRFGGSERYWEQMLSLSDLSLRLASEWGLINFNPEPCIQWALGQIKDNRAAAKDMKVDSFDLLSEYLSECAAQTVVVMSSNDQGIVVDQNRIPRDTIRVRFDLHRTTLNQPFTRGTLTVDRRHFRQWLSTRGGDPTGFKKDMRAAGALFGPDTDRGSLGKNTPIRLRQMTVFRFDLTHPHLAELLDNMGDVR